MTVSDFVQELRTQRWDDHRFYHQSRINQSLHFVSAIGFIVAYVYLFIDPAVSGLIGWGWSMITRQSGHFFFEPRGYDQVNQVSDAHKEAIKVGYNISRKIVLMAAWAAVPVLLAAKPDLFGLIAPASGWGGWLHDVGIAWVALGAAGLIFRVIQLGATKSLFTGIVWATKIVTDPFHDLALYWKAPLALLRGELLDPMHHVRSH